LTLATRQDNQTDKHAQRKRVWKLDSGENVLREPSSVMMSLNSGRFSTRQHQLIVSNRIFSEKLLAFWHQAQAVCGLCALKVLVTTASEQLPRREMHKLTFERGLICLDTQARPLRRVA
jgi:hypothetical protein